MLPEEILAYFGATIPNDPQTHIFGHFASHASRGNLLPFTVGIVRALNLVEPAASGYAVEMISRMAAVPGTGEQSNETLLQIVAEIYVTAGAVESADHDAEGNALFGHEPGAATGKNPEFEACAENIWYAVEVKTPKLLEHARKRATAEWQLTARMPRDIQKLTQTPLLPRDNPVKDFLVSSNEKFANYSMHRPDAYRILSIVWDDFVNEPLAALLNPESGLLTDNSFLKDGAGEPVRFPLVDAVLLCRYQHQISRLTSQKPLIDNAEGPLLYHHYAYPPKVLVQNPFGKPFPKELLAPLNATPLHNCPGAEHSPTANLIMWVDAP